MSSVNIIPKPSTVQITRFYIVAVRAELYKSATVSVDLFNQNTFVRNELIPLTEEEYNSWIVDDDIVDLVMDKLGFEKSPEPEPEVVVEPEPPVETVVEEEKKEPVEETPVVVE